MQYDNEYQSPYKPSEDNTTYGLLQQGVATCPAVQASYANVAPAYTQQAGQPVQYIQQAPVQPYTYQQVPMHQNYQPPPQQQTSLQQGQLRIQAPFVCACYALRYHESSVQTAASLSLTQQSIGSSGWAATDMAFAGSVRLNY